MMGSGQAEYRAVVSNVSIMPIVAIRSLSKAEWPVTIACLSDGSPGANSTLRIQPNQTLLVQACRDAGTNALVTLHDALVSDVHPTKAVGIAVSSPIPSMDLAVFGIVVHGGSQELFSGFPFWAPGTL